MRSACRRSWPCSMHRASAFSSRAGVVSVASSLVSSSRSISEGWRRQKAHAPVRRQDLGEAADVDRALQAIERAQARRVLGRDVAVGVVLDDVEVVLVGQLQHAVRAARGQAVAGGVVEHAHADVELGLVHFAIRAITSRSGPSALRGTGSRRMPSAVSRANSTAQPGSSTITWSPGAQQRAADDVQRMRGADGRDDVFRRGMHAQASPASWKARGASRCRPCGSPYCSENSCSDRRAGHLAHRRRHESRLQPFGREHAHAGLRLVADLVEHAADQRRRVDRRIGARRRQSRRSRPGCARLIGIARLGRRLRRLAAALAHEEAAVLAGFHHALRQQLVVRGHHRRGAHALLLRALPHRRQASARRQQAVADALGEAADSCSVSDCEEALISMGASSCIAGLSQYRCPSELANCTGRVLGARLQ